MAPTTQCNAPVVTGTTEVCNGKDDDCDGLTDETFLDKGTPASRARANATEPA